MIEARRLAAPVAGVLLMALALWFLAADLTMVADEAVERSVATRWIGYIGHIASAIPVLLAAPVQFIPAVRQRWPRLHRRLGQVFLGGALVAGVFAVWLGITMPTEGTQLPLALFGCIWILFSAIAWQAARRGDYATHRRFVLRSFALATSFLFLHLLQEGEAQVFGFMDSLEARYINRGWVSMAVPVLAAEACLTWWPAARRVFGRRDLPRTSLPEA